jgi:pimeloyl-ACP methyl ester carboxylesterase
MALKSTRVQLCGYGVNLASGNESGAVLIILLHGFGAGVFSWKPVFNQLAELGHVIAYDRPAFGDTERPLKWSGTNPYSLDGQVQLLDEVIAKFAAGRPVVLLGHSAGGQIAAEYVMRHPGRVQQLILEDPAILAGGPPEAITKLFRSTAFNKIGPKMAAQFVKRGDRLLYASWFDKFKITQQTLDDYHAPMHHADAAKAFFEFIRAPKKATVQKHLGELDLPVFVISGDHDKVVKVEQTFKVTEQIPGHRIYLVPNCGHIPHEEQPEDFLRVVADFIRKASSSQH